MCAFGLSPLCKKTSSHQKNGYLRNRRRWCSSSCTKASDAGSMWAVRGPAKGGAAGGVGVGAATASEAGRGTAEGAGTGAEGLVVVFPGPFFPALAVFAWAPEVEGGSTTVSAEGAGGARKGRTLSVSRSAQSRSSTKQLHIMIVSAFFCGGFTFLP